MGRQALCFGFGDGMNDGARRFGDDAVRSLLLMVWISRLLLITGSNHAVLGLCNHYNDHHRNRSVGV